MIRIAILLSSILIINASIPYWPDLDNENEIGEDKDFALHETPHKISYTQVENEPLWVLGLDNGQDLEMRPANPEEEKDFEENNRRLIENFKRRHNPIREAPKTINKGDRRDMIIRKEDIFRMLNKLALSTREQPLSYLPKNFDNEPSIVLYFKGPYTSLTVTAEHKQWNYFITPPSPLPSWFYEPRASAVMPEELKQPFFTALWRMLYLFLSHPV